MLEITELQYLSFIVLMIGVLGIIKNRHNLILMLISVEIILLAVNINLFVGSLVTNDLMGQLYALMVLTVAAAESAIGLAIILVYYRVRSSINLRFMNLLKG